MFEFDHVGITTTVRQPDENWVEQSRVWVTNPRNHPEHIEFLRYEPDSTVPEAIKAKLDVKWWKDSTPEPPPTPAMAPPVVAVEAPRRAPMTAPKGARPP